MVLFNIFISDLFKGAESKLIKFLDRRDDQNIREQVENFLGPCQISKTVRVKYVHQGQAGKSKLPKGELCSSNLFRNRTEKYIDANTDLQQEKIYPVEQLVFIGTFAPL